MSFLNSVLSSIETGKPTPIPPPAIRVPASVNTETVTKNGGRKPPQAPEDKSARSSALSAGIKRKAEEQLHRPDNLDGLPSSKQPPPRPASAPSATIKSRPTLLPIPTTLKPAAKPPIMNEMLAPAKPLPAISPKTPPKGSFADLMLKARAAQEKAPVHVGVLKHQPVPKERLSKAEKKKRAMEALVKKKEAQTAKKPGSASSASGSNPAAKPGEGAPLKRREPEENAYKGTARPTQLGSRPAYKGTSGLAPRGKSDEKAKRVESRRDKPPRRDEYLATDEEDEGEYYTDDYYDSYSDESDMEGGFDDVVKEEEAALQAAKAEDEEDIRQELAAKKEKMERRKKLAALASRSRR